MMPVPSPDGFVHVDGILKALEVSSLFYRLHSLVNFPIIAHKHLLFVLLLQFEGTFSEDPAIVQPCITVLKNINSSFFEGLKIEAQVYLLSFLLYTFLPILICATNI